MYCQLDRKKCIACGLCQTLAPQFFDYTDDGLAIFFNKPEATTQLILAHELADVTAAVKRCPTRAIVLTPTQKNS